MGNLVRSVTPSLLPQGAVLSASPLHSRLEGQRKPTGPMEVPRAPDPWTSSAAMAADERARAVKRVVERIFGGRGSSVLARLKCLWDWTRSGVWVLWLYVRREVSLIWDAGRISKWRERAKHARSGASSGRDPSKWDTPQITSKGRTRALAFPSKLSPKEPERPRGTSARVRAHTSKHFWVGTSGCGEAACGVIGRCPLSRENERSRQIVWVAGPDNRPVSCVSVVGAYRIGSATACRTVEYSRFDSALCRT